MTSVSSAQSEKITFLVKGHVLICNKVELLKRKLWKWSVNINGKALT